MKLTIAMLNTEGIDVGRVPRTRRDKIMKISEIFRSIQGESTFQGQPCTFVRLAGCNLSCAYCDTQHASNSGQDLSQDQVVNKVKSLSDKGLVEITGGEPLIQDNVYSLAQALLGDGYKVLIETNGTLDVSRLNPQLVKIMDVKCPSSGESDKMHWPNLEILEPNDQVKFVIADRNDYNWANDIIKRHQLTGRLSILFSVVWGRLDLKDLTEWVLEDNVNVIIHPQLHKIIWGPDTKM